MTDETSSNEPRWSRAISSECERHETKNCKKERMGGVLREAVHGVEACSPASFVGVVF